jgi:Cysteine-rich secretory protein family
MVHQPIVISMIAPVAVGGILIMTILAATVNAQESNSTENAQQQSNSTENAQESSNAGNATSSGKPENATSPSGSMENTTSGMESNNTGNAQESNSNMTAAAPNIGNARQESNNTGNATLTGVPENVTSSGKPENATSLSGSTASNNTGNMSSDLANGILALMNQERAAVNASGSVHALVWNDTAAAHAKAWADYLAAGKTGPLGITHCIFVPGWEQIESCTHHEGENLVWLAPHNANRSAADYLNFWLSEKKDYHGGPPSTSAPVTGHYTQIVWNTTKSVGCGIAVSPPEIHNGDIMSCRFYPAGNFPRPPY